TVNEGSAFSVSLTNPFDPSSSDTAAGFHYAYAVDGASLASVTYANTDTSASKSFTLDDEPRDHTVTVGILDKNGPFTYYTANVHVNIVAFPARRSSDLTVNEGSAFSVSLTNPFDPSSSDTAAGFHYAYAVDGASLASVTYANTDTSASKSFT